MRSIDDEIQITIPVAEDVSETRWWSIRQPPPSVAFGLQAAISRALGPNVIESVFSLLVIRDDEADGILKDDFALNEKILGNAMAGRLLRNTRLGRSLSHPDDDLGSATNRLRILLRWLTHRFGVDVSAMALAGEQEREKKSMTFKWVQPSLVHRLLLASSLKFCGTAERPRSPTGLAEDTSPGAKLWDAVGTGSLSLFSSALDDILVSADELALLSVWVTCHLFRPF